MIKIIVIDDDELICDNLKDFLQEKKYHVKTAYNAEQGLKLVKAISPHIVFLDLGLPDMSGLEVLQKIKEYEKAIRVIIISSMSGEDIVNKAKTLGASDYVKKPFTMEYLNNVVMAKIWAQVIEHQRETILQIIYALAVALEAKDKYTRGHSEAVARYTAYIVEELKSKNGWEWVNDKINFLKSAALLHDIGKMGIKDGLLNKEIGLTREEKDEIKKHTLVGSRILGVVEDLSEYVNAVRHHHEHWDGSGYPQMLKKDEIPKEARILAVADAFDAMTSERSYRKALPKKKAVEELIRGKEKQFDPEVVDAFLVALEKRNM